MTLSRLVKGFILLMSAGAWAAPRVAPSPAPHRAPLAEHLARAEAHVHALDRHILVAAQQKKVHVTDLKLLDRARRLSRHHLHEPWLWAEYLRHVPDAVLIDNTFDTTVVQQDAETAAAVLGDDLDALWARRRQMEAERLMLWSKIAFRAVADMELYNQPLYRFELKGPAGKPLDNQRMEALKAAVQFVRIVDHLAGQAQDAVDSDPQSVYVQWHTQIAAGRKQMEDQMLLQALVALDVYKPDTDAGRMAADAKQLGELSQTIVDSEHALAAAESADDDDEADASRAQLQLALADTVGAVASLDRSVSKAATAWGIAGVPGTKVVVAGLPDLLLGGQIIEAAPLPSGPVVDLLKLFPHHHTVQSGQWDMTADGLRCLQGGTLLLNYAPPEEYDIEIEFARRTGNDVVGVNLPLSKGDVCFFAGGWANHFIGFAHYANKGWWVLTNHNVPRALENGVSASATIRVRHDSARAYFDGKLVAEIPGGGKGLKIGKNEVDGKSVVGLRVDGLSRAMFYKMRLIEITGHGQIVPMSSAVTTPHAPFDDRGPAVPTEIAAKTPVASVMLATDFNRVFAASFPVSNNLAASGDVIASSDTHGVSPAQVFAGSRDGKDWHLADHSGFLEATWKHPPTGQYILLFGRTTAPGHDNWGTAQAIINKTDTVNVASMTGSHVVLIDLRKPTAISSLRIEMNGEAYPGICAIEIHATK